MFTRVCQSKYINQHRETARADDASHRNQLFQCFLFITKMDIIVDILNEFLEIAIYNILHSRQIYPDGIFVKKKKYGIPVQISVHPGLNEYVANCVRSMKSKLLSNEVQAVAVAFIDESTKEILERFVIEIGDIKKAVSHCEHNLMAVEAVLRSFCLKIATCSAELRPLPQGCVFKLFIHTRTLTPLDIQPISDPTKEIVWIEAESRESKLENPTVIPIKSADNSILQMQLFIETRDQIGLG